VSARTRLAALAAALALLAAAPAGAHATAVTGDQLRALAARAGSDPAARDRLLAVDSVDGRRADVAAALAGAEPGELAARLRTLALEPEAPEPAHPGVARTAARSILAQRRFSPPRLPVPFRGLIERIAGWVAPIGDLIPALDGLVPGGRPVAWALLALIVATGAALLARHALRRRATAAAHGPPAATAVAAEGPDELERRALAAAARGEHELALRLRFRAGLCRLDRRGVIELRPSLSTAAVARTLRSPDFDRIAARFDEVAYGGRDAAAADVEAARTGWAAVLGDRRAA
jgi:hypothetical protein